MMNADDLDWEPPTEAEMKLIEARRDRSDQISKLMSNYLLKGYKMLGSTCSKCDTILLQDRQGTNYCVACSELDSDSSKDNPVVNQSAAMSMAKELELASASLPTANSKSSSPTGKTVVSLQRSPSTQTTSVAGVLPPHSHTSEAKVKEEPDTALREEASALPFLSMSSIDVQSYTTKSDAKSSPTPSQPDPSSSSSSAFKTSSQGIAREPMVTTMFAREDESSAQPGIGLRASDESIHQARLAEKIKWASLELQGTKSIEYSLHLCQLIKTAAEAIVALRQARM